MEPGEARKGRASVGVAAVIVVSFPAFAVIGPYRIGKAPSAGEDTQKKPYWYRKRGPARAASPDEV